MIQWWCSLSVFLFDVSEKTIQKKLMAIKCALQRTQLQNEVFVLFPFPFYVRLTVRYFFSDNIEPEEIIENVTCMQVFFDLIVCYLTTYQSANHHFTT